MDLHEFWNILEHSGTVQICTLKEFQLGTQTDTNQLGLVELRLCS